ncbi:HAD family hydrolase, partial [Stenotrophomonas sp. MB339]|uniref:HAD family hydrolase n=1 Tax=Stenotrophomonas sp. MB339 TaxID=1663558 RepID=UPI0031B60200
MGRAAQVGVRLRDAQAIGQLRLIDTLIVDKTGTLTEGRPAFRDTLSSAGFDADQSLCLAGTLEQASERPLAQAIVAEAPRRGVNLVAAPASDSLHGHATRGLWSDQPARSGYEMPSAS